MKLTSKLILAGLALALPAGAATSLTIAGPSASVPTLTTTGTIVRAYNLGTGTNVNGAGSASTSVHQTITFQDIAITGNHTTSTLPSTVGLSQYALDVGGVQISTVTSGTHFGQGTFGDALFGSFIFANGSGANQSLSITGLDNTQTYLVQVLFGDNRTQSFANWNLSVFLDGVDSGQDVVYNATTGSPDVYNLAAVTVSAQTSLDFRLQVNSGAGPGISGVVVSVIPEPSTALLGGLGVLALLRRRRNG